MPISTTCEKCHRPLRAKSSLAGKVVRCPRCSWEIEIPAESEAASVERVAALPPRTARDPDAPVDMPALQRHKYRPKRESLGVLWRKKRILNIPLRWWVTVVALVLVIGWAVDRVRSGLPDRQATQGAIRQDATEVQKDAQTTPVATHRPDSASTSPAEAERPAPAESTAPPKVTTATHEAPKVAAASPAASPKPASPDKPRTQVEAPGKDVEPSHATRDDAPRPRVAPYSKQNPPEVEDIVTVLVGGPPLVGKVTKVDAKANKCKIKIIDAREFEASGTLVDTGRTRTVRLDQLKPHPRMLAGHPADQSESPPVPKPTSPGL